MRLLRTHVITIIITLDSLFIVMFTVLPSFLLILFSLTYIFTFSPIL